MKHRLLVFAFTCAALLALPSLASAAITETNITSPSGFISLTTVEEGGTSDVLNVSGTATGTDGDEVEIRCYWSATDFVDLSGPVAISGGTFTAPPHVLNDDARTCHLRAVPVTNPADLTPFTGPGIALNLSSIESTNGKDYDYYRYFGGSAGAFDYRSISDCGINESYLTDPATLYTSTRVFWCNQYIYDDYEDNSKSSLQIDGKNAFASGVESPLTALAGFQPVVSSYTVDPATGNAVINELQILMTCPSNNAWRPSTGNCADLAPLPVRMVRTMTQTDDGLETVVTDNYVSTDGQPHSLSVGYEQNWCMSLPGCSSTMAYNFPGYSQLTDPTSQEVNGPFPSGSTITVFKPGAAVDDPAIGRGALTMTPGADRARFDGTRYFMLYWNNRTIPAFNSLQISARFDHNISQIGLEALIADKSGDQIPPYTGNPPPAVNPPAAASPTIGKGGSASAKYDKKKKVVNIATGKKVSCPAGGGTCTVTAALSAKYKKGKKSKVYKLKRVSIKIPAGKTSPIVFTLKKGNPLYVPKGSGGANPLTNIKQAFTGTVTATATGAAPATSKLSFKLKLPKIPKKK